MTFQNQHDAVESLITFARGFLPQATGDLMNTAESQSREALMELVRGALAVLQGNAVAVPIEDAQRASPPEEARAHRSRGYEFGRGDKTKGPVSS
jgi:hypothetical protein